MLIRIFHPVREKIGLFIQAFMVFMVAYYIAIFLARVFGCTPISAFWEGPGPGRCINLDALFIVDTFVSLITDGIILVLPIFLAASLHLPLRKKIRVAVVLGAGGLAVVANTYRVYLVMSHLGAEDFTYIIHLSYTRYIDVYPLSILSLNLSNKICSAAETAIGLICACLPAINGLILHKRKPNSQS
jgi:hypothetical protein